MHLHRVVQRAALSIALCGCGGSATDQETLVPALSLGACLDLGGAPIGLTGVPGMASSRGDPLLDAARDDACPADRRKIGTLESSFDANGALCCEVPPVLTPEDCEAKGGIAFNDPGDGSSLLNGCDGMSTEAAGAVIGWLICERPATFCSETGVCCRQ
jgi:hypothetical protein